MSRRVAALSAACFVLASCGGEDDADRIGRLVSTITGELDAESVEAGLGWADPDRAPVDVRAHGLERVYGAGDGEALRSEGRRALARFMGQNLRAMRQTVEIDGDEADVSLQLLSGQGMAQVDLGLRKVDETTWLINRVSVR